MSVARASLVLLIFTFLWGIPVSVRAQNEQIDDAYIVKSVKVDVTAESAAEAREQAFEQAQKKAFKKLSDRFLSADAQQRLGPVEPDTIAPLVESFEILSEQRSDVRYIGTYLFRFEPERTRQFFASRGLAFTDVGRKPILVLPLLQRGTETLLWSGENTWLQAWRDARLQQGLVTVVVPMGDARDLRQIAGENAFSADPSRLRGLAERYGAEEVLFLLALPAGPNRPNQTRDVRVYIYAVADQGPQHIKTLRIAAPEEGNEAELWSRAVRRTAKTLEENWKEQTLVDPDLANHIRVRVKTPDLEHWTRISEQLADMGGRIAVELLAQSRRETWLDLRFQGSEKRLRLALAQADLDLSSPRLAFGYVAADTENRPPLPGESDPLTYDLSLRR